MEYTTYLIAKSLVEQIARLEKDIKIQQSILDGADDCMKGSEDEKVMKDYIDELYEELAELEVEFINL